MNHWRISRSSVVAFSAPALNKKTMAALEALGVEVERLTNDGARKAANKQLAEIVARHNRERKDGAGI